MNQANSGVLAQYVGTIEKELAAGDATEHTHRPALKFLIEGLVPGVSATNEPKHIECGAPDFVIKKGPVTIGYIEAKDVGKSLDEAEKTDQLKRYRESLTNFILTDYLEFRWYIDGERCFSARLGTPTKDGKIKRDKDGSQTVAELLSNFLAHTAEKVGAPKDLALRMARLAHMIRDLIVAAFKKEPEGGNLHVQLTAFRENLIPDLQVSYFADMYAQTIAYGLFAARCTAPDKKDFTRFDAAQNLPKTNPFLRKLFQHIAGYELDDRIAWLVDDLVQVLAQADMEAVLKDFGKRTAKEDPVVHFYETFLTAYDPKVREMRGVYYTPEPVVSYIVRSIDHLLRTRFNRPQGLMDANTLVLDPAVGTATFLYMVINEIYNEITKQGQQGLWNDYVDNKLLPRIFGFELLMAPYAVAHLKLGLLLQETDYQFKTDQRLGIYLTNTLEEAIKHSETLFAQWITEEANAAAEIKRDKPIMVVLGNPPYSGIPANRSEVERWVEKGKTYIKRVFNDPRRWIEQIATKSRWVKEPNFIGKLLIDYYEVDGKPLKEKNPKWLQDDYVKFIRFGQWRIERTGQGILGFITNHSYLDNPTFRGMRQSLMNTFTDIYILNLHGSSRRGEQAPSSIKDENVFDIQQGVAIAIFDKELGKTGPATVHYANLWGMRGEWPNPQEKTKYRALMETNVESTEWVELTPNSPFYLFVPLPGNLLAEYEKGWKVTDIFPVNGVGMTTARDHMVIDYEPQPLFERATIFRDSEDSNASLCERLNISQKLGWDITRARQMIRQEENLEQYIKPVLYRPFDARLIFYHDSLVWRTVKQVMHHMLFGDNLGLISARSNKSSEMNHFFCSRFIMETKCGESTTQSCLFPLYLYPVEGEMQFESRHRRPNLNPEFVKDVSEKLGLKFIEDGKGDLKETFGPEDIFNYAYAVFHSPTYRTRYAEFLRIDFPRLPLTSDKEIFRALAAKGTKLVSLHLMESPLLNNFITRYSVADSNTVEKVNYDENNQRVYINKTQYFEGVPLEVWDFHLGGYQVAQKWLKDRKGRTLTYDELTHYQKVIVALKETILLMVGIDELIPGWPIE